MDFKILSYGGVAAIIWLAICRRSSRSRGRWASPISLFAVGLLALYILPAIYWQFRNWDYPVPSYFEGLSLVLVGTIVMGASFALCMLLAKPKSHSRNAQLLQRKDLPKYSYQGFYLWYFLVVAVAGILWRIYLLTLGYQGRLAREVVTVFGSDSLGLIVSNIGFYYPATYFALFLLGNDLQRRSGKVCWIFDGALKVITLHRYEMVLFLLRSAVFMLIIGYKSTLRQKLILGASIVLILSVVGQSDNYARDMVSLNSNYIGPGKVVELLHDSFDKYISDDRAVGIGSEEENPIMRMVDDSFFRLYEARSASAVMINVPDSIPFLYGETFVHALYALLPRFVWSDKPRMSEIHMITTWAMPNDMGINPLGTLAELYVNLGFVAVFLGGIFCWWLCWLYEKKLNASEIVSPAWICLYPIFSELYVFQSYNFTQRITEGIRGLVVLFAFWLVFYQFRKINRAVC